jgi:DNA-binding response OmpR family regulator
MVAAMETILVVDDDEGLRDTIGMMLEREKFIPVFASDGNSGLDKAFTVKPRLLLVDLRLPGLSGAEICQKLRAERIRTPIIVLSAAGEEIDKVLLLEMGADDYMVKPFGTRELLARIRALLRRTYAETKVLHFADVEIDVDRRSTTRRGQEIKLTPAEYNLLLYFLQNSDRALTRDVILNSVWGYESYPNSRTVDVHVVRLRQKFEPEPTMPRHFLTMHGVGYRFLP